MKKIGKRLKLAAGGAVLALAAAVGIFVGVVQAAPPGAPANTAPPVVYGQFQTGGTLSVLPGAWSGSPTSFSYQWQSCTPAPPVCTDVAGETNQTYVVRAADVGNIIQVVLIATNASGASDPASSQTGIVVVATGAPSNTSAPSISGPTPPQVGQALQAQTGTWLNVNAYTYDWFRCDPTGANCAAISGATGQSYTPAAADAGNTLRVLVTATSSSAPVGAARNFSAQTQVVGGAGPQNTQKPTITGGATVGSTLTASNGLWTSPNGSPITYAIQWLLCNSQGQNCQPIAGATQQTYTVQQTNLGNTLAVRVTATNDQGSQSATSNPTDVVGGVPVGQTIPVTQVSLPNRLVISAVDYQPNVLRTRAPFTARFRVSDTMGHFVSGAQVNLVMVPYGRVAPAGIVTTDSQGWATFTLQPTSKFPLQKGYLITVFVRALKPGDNILEGVTALRLTSVRINPNL